MDYKSMTTSALLELRKKIDADAQAMGDTPEEVEKLKAMQEDMRKINEELEARKAAAEEHKGLLESIAAGAGRKVDETPGDGRKSDDEIRNSKAYIEAYAEYIKTGRSEEVRGLLSENAAGGTIPVPTIIDDIVRTAWEKNEITRLIKKTYFKGNLDVDVELSGDLAVFHDEGSAGPSEENLIHATVTLIPKFAKKWITVTDEVMALRGEAFLRYIYDEITYRIAKAIANKALDKIIACGTVSTNTPSTALAVASIKATQISVGLVAQAEGELQADAENPVVILNRKTWSALKAAQAANGFNYDPFEGLPVIFTDHLKAFSVASSGDTYMIVGDLGNGVQANFPEGEDVRFTFDDVTLATDDKVKITGKEFLGLEVVNQFMFAKVTK